MEVKKWENTCNRFVAFFDILGFKELVLKESHEKILKKLELLKNNILQLENPDSIEGLKGLSIDKDQTRSVTFSDSIIFFSKSNSYNDALKIFVDAYRITSFALENEIAIKGCISFGEVTVDFSKNIFFGKPIINSFLLHEELKMLSVIIDHNAEVQLKTYKSIDQIKLVLVDFKVFFKSARITHKIIKPTKEKMQQKRIENVEKLYETTSGVHRMYIDNTIEFLKSLKY